MSYITVGAVEHGKKKEKPTRYTKSSGRPARLIRERKTAPRRPSKIQPVKTHPKIVVRPVKVRRPDGKIVVIATPTIMTPAGPVAVTQTPAGPAIMTPAGPVAVTPGGGGGGGGGMGPGPRPEEVETAPETEEVEEAEVAPEEAEPEKRGIPTWAWLLGGGVALWWIWK